MYSSCHAIEIFSYKFRVIFLSTRVNNIFDKKEKEKKKN